MKLTARNVLVAFALFCSFQVLTGFVGGVWEGFQAATPFRIHDSDVFSYGPEGNAWKINCPVCCGLPENFIVGTDRYDGSVIRCPGCNGFGGVVDVRRLPRPVRIVERAEPHDYPKAVRNRWR